MTCSGLLVLLHFAVCLLSEDFVLLLGPVDSALLNHSLLGQHVGVLPLIVRHFLPVLLDKLGRLLLFFNVALPGLVSEFLFLQLIDLSQAFLLFDRLLSLLPDVLSYVKSFFLFDGMALLILSRLDEHHVALL